MMGKHLEHRLITKTVTFDVKNGVINSETITSDIWNLANDMFGISISISNLDVIGVNNFYTTDASGRTIKILKPIKTEILKKCWKKDDNDKVMYDENDNIIMDIELQDRVKKEYPLFGQKLSNLYSRAYTVRTFFGNKKMLGQSIYEESGSCFRDGGENEVCKTFLTLYKRSQILVLERLNENGDVIGKGRCIAYFPGGRKIILLNFYSNGMDKSPATFIEGIRHLFGFDKVTFKHIGKNDFFLPIYKNGDAVQITMPRSFDYIDRALPCPHCEDMIPEKEYEYKLDGSTVLLGCSNCYDEHDNRCSCENCGRMMNEDDTFSLENYNGVYCESCYNDNVYHCHHCEQSYWGSDDLTLVNDNYYCDDCYNKYITRCYGCGFEDESSDNFYVYDNDYICQECYEKNYFTCEDCGEVYRNSDVNQNDDGVCYCESCFKELEKVNG